MTGVDPSQVMLRLGRWLAVLGRSRNVVFVEGTAESLPLPDESATVVWALRSFHHWTDHAAGISEAHRVLAPGGRVIIAERLIKPGARGRGAHGLSSLQADRLAYGLRATGFSDVRQLPKGAGRQSMFITLGLGCIRD